MKSTLLAAALLALATSVILGQTANHVKSMNSYELAIRQLLNDIATALTRSDTAALDSYYTEDYTFVNPSGVLLTKEQTFGGLRSGAIKFTSFGYEDMNVRSYGDTAVVTARVVLSGKDMKGQPLGSPSRATFTLVRIRGGWKLAAIHSTLISEQ